MILWEIIIYSFPKSVPCSLSNKSFLPKLYFVMKFVFKGKKHCQSSLNKNKIKWNKIIKEIRRRRRRIRTINDFHCCKILNLNSHFAKLRSSSYFPRGSPANKAACITCRREGNVTRGGKPWETTVFLSCAVKHAPYAHSHASRRPVWISVEPWTKKTVWTENFGIVLKT